MKKIKYFTYFKLIAITTLLLAGGVVLGIHHVSAATNTYNIASVEKAPDNKIFVAGTGPTNQNISIQINGKKRIETKVSNDGKYHAELNENITSIGYLQIFSIKKGFFRDKYDAQQNKKYYSLLDQTNTLSDQPPNVSINSVVKKGEKFQIEGRYLPNTKVLLKEADKNIKKTKTDKNGFFKFTRTKLSSDGESYTLSAQIKKRWFSSQELAISKKLYFDDKTLVFSDIRPILPAVAFDEFYEWLTTDRQDAMLKSVGTPFQIIMSTCGQLDRDFGNMWIACMQKGYKDYLKPETFENNNWLGDYTDMMGNINSAVSEKRLYGTFSETYKWKQDIVSAETIYERIAISK